jgi:hypothetical protein
VSGRRREVARAAGRVGEEIVRARIAFYLGGVAAVTFGGLALLVVLVLAIAGTGPGLGPSVLIVAAVALVGALGARAVVRRVSVATVTALAGRLIARQRRRRGR